MDYQFNIQGHLKISKLDQLCRHLIAAILSGDIPPAIQLPSITSLAKINHVSRDTTEKAYCRLTQLGYIESVAGRGHFANMQPECFPSADPALKKLDVLYQPLKHTDTTFTFEINPIEQDLPENEARDRQTPPLKFILPAAAFFKDQTKIIIELRNSETIKLTHEAHREH